MTNSCDPLLRRDFLTTLGLAALPVLNPGCDVEPQATDFRGKPPSKQKPGAGVDAVQVQVQRALLEQALIDDRQRCSLPAGLAGLAGVGRQVRITRDDLAALYTVDEHRPSDDPDVVRMNLNARHRLETSEPFAGAVSNVLTASGLNDAQAQAQGEFVERLVDDGNNNGLIVLAVHGGDIEAFTDLQAEHLTATLGASSWICKGWRKDGSAYDAWHIRSTDLHPHSFVGLQAIANRGFAYAVSFHGMAGDAGVLIGGGGPLELKQLIGEAIRAAIDTSIPVTVASPTDVFNGDSPLNCVNWLTAGGVGGIQIEQDYLSRIEYGLVIAEAIAGVLESLL